MRKISRHKPGDKGFSFVEIIVVIAIMSISLAIAMPSIINYYPHMQLKQTSMELYASLQRARSNAIGSTDKYGIEFDLGAAPQTHQLQVRVVNPDNGAITWKKDPRNALTEISGYTGLLSVTVGAAAPVTTGKQRIFFNPIGTAMGSTVNGNVTITLFNRRDTTDTSTVTVNVNTGRIKINAGVGGG